MLTSAPCLRFDSAIVRAPSATVVNGLRAKDRGNPDSIFVEDPALVFTEGAILLRSGAPSRMGEAARLVSAHSKIKIIPSSPEEFSRQTVNDMMTSFLLLDDPISDGF